jgi:hypothetical protein
MCHWPGYPSRQLPISIVSSAFFAPQLDDMQRIDKFRVVDDLLPLL